jgi:hypothetical protein
MLILGARACVWFWELGFLQGRGVKIHFTLLKGLMHYKTSRVQQPAFPCSQPTCCAGVCVCVYLWLIRICLSSCACALCDVCDVRVCVCVCDVHVRGNAHHIRLFGSRV